MFPGGDGYGRVHFAVLTLERPGVTDVCKVWPSGAW